ncbi:MULTISPECIES: hypothetical protein [Nitrosomonas]|uniref:hypothetical protein n=1 Tax=Nitrosomonas TaxID=914 RepID=UPI0011875A81|nr:MULTISPECIES: hypothetical protein [Nitrosomonas]UVS60849.1 hypothetical protein NX761_15330 [Nitrosomonas sp. PLL12]
MYHKVHPEFLTRKPGCYTTCMLQILGRYAHSMTRAAHSKNPAGSHACSRRQEDTLHSLCENKT